MRIRVICEDPYVMPDESPLTEILGRVVYEAAQVESAMSLLLESIVAAEYGWVLINGASANSLIEWLSTIAKREDFKYWRELAELCLRARDLNNKRNHIVHATWAHASPDYFNGETDEDGGYWVALRERQRQFLLQDKQFKIRDLRDLVEQLRQLRQDLRRLDLIIDQERYRDEDADSTPRK